MLGQDRVVLESQGALLISHNAPLSLPRGILAALPNPFPISSQCNTFGDVVFRSSVGASPCGLPVLKQQDRYSWTLNLCHLSGCGLVYVGFYNTSLV